MDEISALGETTVAADVKQLMAENVGLRAELAQVKAEHGKLQDAHAQLQTAHAEVINKTGFKQVKSYEYGENECRPVALGGTCEMCGWVRDTQMRPGDKQKEPHAII